MLTLLDWKDGKATADSFLLLKALPLKRNCGWEFSLPQRTPISTPTSLAQRQVTVASRGVVWQEGGEIFLLVET